MPIIRSALPADEASWRALWRGYCDFYGENVSEAVTDRTWKRILDPDSDIMCIVAEVDGQVYGFANCVVHENTWETQAGLLAGRPVRPALRARARDRQGADRVAAQRHARRGLGPPVLDDARGQRNARASSDDQFAQADGFVRYVIKQRQHVG